MAYNEKNKTNKKTKHMVLLVSSKVGLPNNCPIFKVYNIVPLVREKDAFN